MSVHCVSAVPLRRLLALDASNTCTGVAADSGTTIAATAAGILKRRIGDIDVAP